MAFRKAKTTCQSKFIHVMLLPIPFSSADSCQQALQCALRRGLNGGRGNQARASRPRPAGRRAPNPRRNRGRSAGRSFRRGGGIGRGPSGTEEGLTFRMAWVAIRFRRRGGRRNQRNPREGVGSGAPSGCLSGRLPAPQGGNPENVACGAESAPRRRTSCRAGEAPPANRPEVFESRAGLFFKSVVAFS